MSGRGPGSRTAPAERDGSDVSDPWAAIEACDAKGWTDGLPVVPPIDTLVDAMVASGPWTRGEVLLHEPVRDLTVTAEKAAINAVMTGCRPEYFPSSERRFRRSATARSCSMDRPPAPAARP